jgi:hypothetical protein
MNVGGDRHACNNSRGCRGKEGKVPKNGKRGGIQDDFEESLCPKRLGRTEGAEWTKPQNEDYK